MASVRVFGSGIAFVDAAAGRLLELVARAAADRSEPLLALAGGSTPVDVYRRIAERLATDPEELSAWRRCRYFWSDERLVAESSPESNVGMVRTVVLGPLGVAPERIFVPMTDRSAPECARRYEDEIREQAETSECSFDLLLLGLGEDGHVASLFPPAPPVAADRRETGALVEAGSSPAGVGERVTFSYELIRRARRVVVLVRGGRKAEAVFGALVSQDPVLPATRVAAEAPASEWLLDREAAALLGGPPAVS